jgi:hypothetical protein
MLPLIIHVRSRAWCSRRFWPTAALLVVLCQPNRAAVAEPAEVESLIREALDLRRDGRDGRAFPLLQRAHALGSTPRTAAQLGLVEINLGYWLEAERHLASSLAAGRDPWVEQNRGVLEQNLARARAAIGEIAVAGMPAGAEVWVNGKKAGHLPLASPVRAGEGPATVELRAPGHVTAHASLDVVGGVQKQLSINLQRETSSRSRSAAVAQLAVGRQARSSEVSAFPQRPPAWQRPAAWTAGAAFGATLGFAVYQTVSWQGRRNDFDSHTSNAGGARIRDCGVDEPGRGGPGCAAIYSDMTRAKKLAVVGYVAGGILAAGSAALFVLSRDDRSRESASACLPALTGLGGTCVLYF